MMPYQLNLDITPANLQTLIDNKQQIILAKGDVAWVTITPLLNNCVQWSDNYYLYAQMERVQPGSHVQMAYQTAALPGHSYDFKPFGSFFPSESGAAQPNTYQIVNLFTQQPYITLGMAQPVQVNGSLAMVNPINAVSAPSNTTMVFSADNQVTVFISNTVTVGEVLPTPSAVNALKIDFSLSTSEVNIIHDAEAGGFVHAGL